MCNITVLVSESWNESSLAGPGASNPHCGWEITPHISDSVKHTTFFGPNTKAQSYSLALCGWFGYANAVVRIATAYIDLCAVYMNIHLQADSNTSL